MVAVNHGERAVALAEAAAAPSTLVTTLLARGIARLTAGLLRDAQTDFERALKLSETAELWAYRSQIETNLGIVYIEVAEYDMAERCLLSALDVAGKHDSVFVWANLGALYWQTERWDKLRDAGYQLLLLSENQGTSWGMCVAESFRGFAALSLQLSDEAAVASRRVIELLGSNIRIADVSYGAIFLARIEAGRSLQDAIRRLECFKETIGAASILSRLRIDLEIANLCAGAFPDRGWAIASSVRTVAVQLGASSIAIRADRCRDACRYVSSG
jgi:tetratricopeptide (TPR) repeat protein